MMVMELLGVSEPLKCVDMKIKHETPGKALYFIVCRLKTIFRLLFLTWKHISSGKLNMSCYLFNLNTHDVQSIHETLKHYI